jgi:GMP synthase PP-ATPase subunit
MDERENYEKDELQRLVQEADEILKEELKRKNIDFSLAEARATDAMTVCVQGDERTYWHPIEITLYKDDKFIWRDKSEFIERLSNRMTNEIKGGQ